MSPACSFHCLSVVEQGAVLQGCALCAGAGTGKCSGLLAINGQRKHKLARDSGSALGKCWATLTGFRNWTGSQMRQEAVCVAVRI